MEMEMETNTEDKRIPIEQFADFVTCRLDGMSSGIKFDAFMEAIEMARRERKKNGTPHCPTIPQDTYISLRGREPGPKIADEEGGQLIAVPLSGEVGDSQIAWSYLSKWTKHWNQVQVMESMLHQQGN